MDFIRDFFDWILEIWNVGIFETLEDFAVWALIKAGIVYVEFRIWAMGFAWDVAEGILAGLNLSEVVNDAFSMLSHETRQALMFFRVPEAINWLASGVVSRFVLRLIPGA